MSRARTTWLAWTTLLLAASSSAAAEIQLRAECVASGPVVTLGDLAEVASADSTEAARLAAIELFPAPGEGRPRFARQREVQDLLLLQGVNVGQHRFSGASQTVVRRSEGVKSAGPLRPLSEATQRRARRQLCEAIVAYLGEAAGRQPWSVEADLTEDQARLVAGIGSTVTVSGGRSPWVGPQKLEVSVTPPGGAAGRFAVDAHVTLPDAVVVTTRALPRGAVLGEADVQLDRGDGGTALSGRFHAIEEVVGKETTRAVPAGMALDEESVRSPLLVRRGEIVSVTALGAGIRVTTNARAREDGSLGELIRVETLEDRAAYFARVSALRHLEVYAGPVRTDREAPARPPRPQAGGTRIARRPHPSPLPLAGEGSGVKEGQTRTAVESRELRWNVPSP